MVNRLFLNIIGDCFQMLFILVIPLFGNWILLTFDNTAMIDPKPDQLQPCQIVGTEHFSQTTGDYSEGRLAVQSSQILQEIVTHLLFIIPVEKNIYFNDSQQQFITFISFQMTFAYTTMSIPADYLRACHPVLFLTQKIPFYVKMQQ